MVMMRRRSNTGSRDIKYELETLLRSFVERIPFFKLVTLRRELSAAKDGLGRPDWYLDVLVRGESWTIYCETAKSGQPRELRVAMLQLRHALSLLPDEARAYGIVLAPYISKESAEFFKGEAIGYADLAGNAWMSFDQVFIDTRVAGNPLSVKREARSVFSPKATRVLTHLLQRPLRAWKVKELSEAAGVSYGHISAVRQKLLEREWATEDAKGLIVTKSDAVLDAWAQQDNWGKRTEVREYVLADQEGGNLSEGLSQILAGGRYAFTRDWGAAIRKGETPVGLATAYVDEFPADGFALRRVDGGGQVRLVVPKDEGVFHCSRDFGGTPIVCDLQLYLDLLGAGEIGAERAAALRKQCLPKV